MHLIKPIILFLLLALFCQLNAQPLPCLDSIPDMTPLCGEACIICDIDGFTGRHDSAVSGEAPDDFCTFVVHNAQWIAFIAGSEELSVEIEVNNCDIGGGLEIAFYESLDCENFSLISNCFGAQTAIPQGSTGTVTINTPLTIGQYYYVVMDGQMGDNCNWTLNVVSGNTEVSPLTTSGIIEGDFDVCPGIMTSYETQVELGATMFDWTLNNQAIQANGASTTIDWIQDGIYELCVTASNACDEAPPSCQIIEVTSIEPQLFEESICDGDCFELNDTISLCNAGFYEFKFLTNENCDSTIIIDLDVLPESMTDLDIEICDGDSIFIGSTPFYQTGLFTEVVSNYYGCDSTVNLDLFIIICEIEGESDEKPVVCFGGSNGEINFQVENGTAPFTYEWTKLGDSLSATGVINENNINILIPDLSIGTYLITIKDEFGNSLVLIQEVTQPNPLQTEIVASDYNDFNISCFGGNDGMLQIFPSGGIDPYTYEWSNDGQGDLLNDLEAGEYLLTVSDNNGCTIAYSSNLLEPEPFSFMVDFVDPNCDGFDTGSIQIQNTTGGVEPYQYQILEDEFSIEDSAQDLIEGTYEVIAQDANFCTIDTIGILTEPIIPTIDLGEDLTIDLGCSIDIYTTSNITLDSVAWSDQLGLSCYNCPEPEATPYNDTEYLLTVTSEDGCIDTDSVKIFVNKQRRVFIPNIFNPTENDKNGYFLIEGGKEILRLLNLKIYSRWGVLVFEKEEISPNFPSLGWDGRFNGDIVSPGVFVYHLEVEFLDGEILRYAGNVTVVY